MPRLIPLLVLVIAAGSLVTGVAAAAPETVKTLEIGTKAPDFSLPDVDGRVRKLSEYAQAKVLVVVFTCNHCPTAQAYEDRIAKLAADYKDKGVVLVAISPNDPKAVRLDELGYSDVSDSHAEMKIRAADKGFKFHYLYDGDKQAAAKAYGPVATPHVFVFDGERKLRYVGRVDDNERDPNAVTSHDARNAIEAVLEGKPVPVEVTKVFGCSVKWSDKRDSAKQAFEQWAREPVTLSLVGIEDAGKLVRNETDKLRLINIWATWCGPCIAEFPELVEINRMYRGRDFEMVGISVDNPAGRAKVQAFLEKHQASFTNCLFDGQNAAAFLEATAPKWEGGIPYTLLVKPGGEVLYTHTGMIDPLELKKIIVGHLGRTYK